MFFSTFRITAGQLLTVNSIRSHVASPIVYRPSYARPFTFVMPKNAYTYDTNIKLLQEKRFLDIYGVRYRVASIAQPTSSEIST